MFDPTLYPYTRVQTYSDGNPPDVLADAFYNPTQDHLGRLFGAGCGSSVSIACEEFDNEGGAIAHVAGGAFGRELIIDTSTHSNAIHTSPIAAGDHGIWVAQNDGGGAHDFIAWDNGQFISDKQFIWTARVRLLGRANFETRANLGMVVGMWGAATDNLPTFITGSDFANWWAYYNDAGDTFIDTGVPAIDDTWFTLIITRKIGDSKLRYYIGTGTASPSLVVTSTNPIATMFSFSRRFVRCVGTAGSAVGDGFYMDFFKRGIER